MSTAASRLPPRPARPRRRWPARLLAVSLLGLVIGGLLLAVLGTGGGAHHVPAPKRARARVRVVRFTLRSAAVHRTLHEILVIPGTSPASGRGRGLLVVLHGAGARPDVNLTPQLEAALGRLGARAPDVLLADGGRDSYWHNRGDGRWASYVIHEAIPQARRRSGASDRVAIAGQSMGGFGALDVARLAPGRFCSVQAHSPALWASAGATAPGAFDDAADFARHDLLAIARRTNPWGATPLWIDVGDRDPFRAADAALARSLRARGAHIVFHVWSGGHDERYWQGNWRRYLAWDAVRLAHCG